MSNPLGASARQSAQIIRSVKARPYPLPALPPNKFYNEPPTRADLGEGSLVFIEGSDLFDSFHYRLNRVVYQGRTAFQNVLIGDTVNYNRALFLDHSIQSSQDDEAMYHEMLVQPAMLLHHDPKDVLIIGGGEGATLREVCVHASVRSATMVDIDGELVALCSEYLPTWHRGAFEDRRVRTVTADGRTFVEQDDGKYDVVIIDVVDLFDNGPAQAIYSRQFHEHLRRRLRPDAIVVVQGLEFSFSDITQHTALARTLRTAYPEVHSYRAGVPSFLSNWGFLIASDWLRPQDIRPDAFDRAILQRLNGTYLNHLTGDFFIASTVMDKDTAFGLSLPGPIIEDDVPFVAPPDVEDVELPYAQFPLRTV